MYFHSKGIYLKDIHIQQIEDLMIYEHEYLVQESKRTKDFIF